MQTDKENTVSNIESESKEAFFVAFSPVIAKKAVAPVVIKNVTNPTRQNGEEATMDENGRTIFSLSVFSAPTFVSFDQVNVGASETRTLVIRNPSLQDVEAKFQCSSGNTDKEIVIEPETLKLLAGQEGQVCIRWDPKVSKTLRSCVSCSWGERGSGRIIVQGLAIADAAAGPLARKRRALTLLSAAPSSQQPSLSADDTKRSKLVPVDTTAKTKKVLTSKVSTTTTPKVSSLSTTTTTSTTTTKPASLRSSMSSAPTSAVVSTTTTAAAAASTTTSASASVSKPSKASTATTTPSLIPKVSTSSVSKPSTVSSSTKSLIPKPSTTTSLASSSTSIAKSTATSRAPSLSATASSKVSSLPETDWKEKQERSFTQWLNFILSDSGATPASSNAHWMVRKVDAVRRKLGKGLLVTPEMSELLCRLDREIKESKLVIRDDRNIQADLGLRDKLIKLVMSYNPAWLRMGLETLFNEIIPHLVGGEELSFQRFLRAKLFTDPSFVPDSKKADSEEQQIHKAGNRFMLKMVLSLVIFLDRAKSLQLIPSDPCLFTKSSDVRCSRDILISFNRDYLAGEGDITKHLGYFGYAVFHQQTPLDEFDFSISDICADLRDGIRLARVVDMLSGTDICSKLRLPAISRLQKIHNISLVVKCLGDNGITLSSSSSDLGRDIVDGNREATLAMVWKLLFHFGVNALISMDTLRAEISRVIRLSLRSIYGNSFNPRTIPQPLPKISKIAGLGADAVQVLLQWVQAACGHFGLAVGSMTDPAFRDGSALCYLVSLYLPNLLPSTAVQRSKPVEFSLVGPNRAKSSSSSASASAAASSSSSSAIQPDIEKVNFKLLRNAVEAIGGVPHIVSAEDVNEKSTIAFIAYLFPRLSELGLESLAAFKIQSGWRCVLLRRRAAAISGSVALIQRVYRGHQARAFLLRRHEAATTIQRVQKGRTVRKSTQLYLGRVKIMQSLARRMILRERVLEQRTVKRVLNAISSRMYDLKTARIIKLCNAATVTLQKCVRRSLALSHHSRVLRAASVIYPHTQSATIRTNYLHSRRKAIKLQNWWRSISVSCWFQWIRAATTCMQSIGRCWIQKKRYCNMQKANTTLTSALRRVMSRSEFLRLKAVAVVAQSQRRGAVALKEYQHARHLAIASQALVRRVKGRSYHLALKKAVVLSQASWRGLRCRISIHIDHLAATLIQTTWRACVDRYNYKLILAAVVKIQTIVRKLQASRRFRDLKESTITAQAHLRSAVSHKSFKSMHFASKVLQGHTRGAGARRYHLQLVNAAINMQSLRRGGSVLRQIARWKQDVTMIQSAWRCHRQYKTYHNLRGAAVTVQSAIQQAFARNSWINVALAAKHSAFACKRLVAREVFCSAVVAATRIQTVQRRLVARGDFVLKKDGIRQLQASIRGLNPRQYLLEVVHLGTQAQAMSRRILCFRQLSSERASSIAVQTEWRRFICHKKYHLCKTAIVVAQSCVRRALLHMSALLSRRASVQLQSHLRRQLAFQGYSDLKTKARVVKSFLRTCVARHSFLRMVFSAAALQKAVHRTLSRQELIVRRVAITDLQAACRETLAVRLHGEQRKASRQLEAMAKRSLVLSLVIVGGIRAMRNASFVGQRVVRQALARDIYSTQHQHVKTIEAAARRWLAQGLYHELRHASIVAQASRRQLVGRRNFLSARNAACALQAGIQRQLLRTMFTCLRQSTIRVQTWNRMLTQQHLFKQQLASSLCLQARIRGLLSSSQHRQFIISSIRLQAAVLQSNLRRSHMDKFGSIQTLQASIRRSLGFGSWLCRARAASCFLKSVLRSAVARQQFSDIISATVAVTAYSKSKIYWGHHGDLLQAAIVSQRLLSRNVAKKFFHEQKSSIVFLQGHQRRLIQHLGYSNRVHAIVLLQGFCRAIAPSRQHHNQIVSFAVVQAVSKRSLCSRAFGSLCDSSVVVQAFCRCSSRRTSHVAAIHGAKRLQAQMRRFVFSTQHQVSKRAATICQSWWKGITRRVWMDNARRSSKQLQACSRRAEATTQWIVWKEAALVLQALSRRTIHSLGHLNARRLAVVVQARVRRQSLQGTFGDMLESAAIFQSVARRYRACHQHSNRINASTVISAALKGVVASHHMGDQRHLALTAERLWRGCLGRQRARMLATERREQIEALQVMSGFFLTGIARRNAAVLWRGALAASLFARTCSIRNWYVLQRLSATRIQALARGTKSRTLTCYVGREMLLRGRPTLVRWSRVTKSAVLLQSLYRGYQVRNVNVRLGTAAKCIQRWWKSRQQRWWFCSLKIVTVAVQQVWKALFAVKRSAAITIQTQTRVFLARRMSKRIGRAIVTVQSMRRGVLARRQASVRAAEARRRIAEAAARAEEHMRLGNRTRAALEVIMTSDSITSCLKATASLEVGTRLSAVCAEEVVKQHAIAILYSLIKSCNRSQPHLELVSNSLATLYNLSKVGDSRYCQAVWNSLDSALILTEQVFNLRETPKLACQALSILSAATLCSQENIQLLRADKDAMQRLRATLRMMDKKKPTAAATTTKTSYVTKLCKNLELLISNLESHSMPLPSTTTTTTTTSKDSIKPTKSLNKK